MEKNQTEFIKINEQVDMSWTGTFGWWAGLITGLFSGLGFGALATAGLGWMFGRIFYKLDKD